MTIEEVLEQAEAAAIRLLAVIPDIDIDSKSSVVARCLDLDPPVDLRPRSGCPFAYDDVRRAAAFQRHLAEISERLKPQMALDLNSANIAAAPISVAINDLIEQHHPPQENDRHYLGASSIGSDCLRRVQYDWMVSAKHKTRARDIFQRGHFMEDLGRQHLVRAGFEFAPKDQHDEFIVAEGQFRGHADGIILAGPQLPGVGYPCIWEHKGVRHSGWQKIDREGLEKSYPGYAIQCWIYQAYLGFTEHPVIFTATDADTMERLHLLLAFDIERAQLWSDRAVAIIKATRAGELLPRFTTNPKDWRCKAACGHAERCWGISDGQAA
jgi:hypothetical protein